MSLVRWGQNGSNVYVYYIDDDNIVCSCEPIFRCKTDEEMAKHLMDHRANGWIIPDWVFDILSGDSSKVTYKNKPLEENKNV